MSRQGKENALGNEMCPCRRKEKSRNELQQLGTNTRSRSEGGVHLREIKKGSEVQEGPTIHVTLREVCILERAKVKDGRTVGTNTTYHTERGVHLRVS